MPVFEYGQTEIDYLKRKDKKLAALIDQVGMIERNHTGSVCRLGDQCHWAADLQQGCSDGQRAALSVGGDYHSGQHCRS